MASLEKGCTEVSLFSAQGLVPSSLCAKRLADEKFEEARVLEKRE